MAGLTITARTALVTGSSRGIGRGVALRLAKCGVGRVGVHYLKNRDAAEETARLLRERGAEAVLIGARGGERILAEDVAARLGTINYEITCGISARVPREHHR